MGDKVLCVCVCVCVCALTVSSVDVMAQSARDVNTQEKVNKHGTPGEW